jgi:ATP-dependent helicase YprA (DUF1998 family)
MSELLPSLQAGSIRAGLLDYLATTFALTDGDAQSALREFLEDSTDGIFKGPFARLRLPFRAAEPGWEDSLGWIPEWFRPYGHQAAAFERLSSSTQERPRPTLVTTGTGSGKTEAFLFPILDHVRRARANGQTGTKALILYPMNALANDQAKRLTALLTSEPALAGITAAIYTGEDSGKRTIVSANGLITDREVIRSSPPDILLTNYKMLDQLLLRPKDQSIWAGSAHSLQYLVLDEFHTYDGAQGTDVAMLLRRLGLTLRSYLTGDAAAVFDERPLGNITPIGTSATLGDKGDPSVMVDFARTVFGEEFPPEAVVTESRMSADEWTASARADSPHASTTRLALTNDAIRDAVLAWRESATSADAADFTRVVLARLAGVDSATLDDEAEQLLSSVVVLPLVHDLVGNCSEAISLADLAQAVLPAEPPAGTSPEQWADASQEFLLYVFAALSHVRALCGPARLPMLNVDLHLWIRELTRIDRRVGPIPRFMWSDDGSVITGNDAALEDDFERPAFPSIYCRHCGRSGWGVTLAPTGHAVEDDPAQVRRKHLSGDSRFRALLYAPAEADAALYQQSAVPGLAHWHVRDRELMGNAPSDDDEALRDGWVLPVLTQTGEDADDASRDDNCPSCGGKDGIRFLGSAIATLLSVSLSTLFGSTGLDQEEKKALVFTDSVQDAAHRAAFVETRSHALTLRSLLMDAVPTDSSVTLEELAGRIVASAGDDQVARYRILAPELADHELFSEFWSARQVSKVPTKVRERVRERLLFDATLEFGLQSRVGRTLELTGSVVAHVDAGDQARLAKFARKALEGSDIEVLGSIDDAQLTRWVRGVLVYMRQQGGIHHQWLDKYIAEDGNRWRIWGGRPKHKGMPAFPLGRPAPEFPRVGSSRAATKYPNLINVSSAQSWYSRWAQCTLQVPSNAASVFARELFAVLGDAEVLHASAVLDSGAAVYSLVPSRVILARVSEEELLSGATLLACSVCANVVPGSAIAVDQLDGAPCLVIRCPGTLKHKAQTENFYRSFYADAAMRRVVAREHTSLLEDKTRLEYETGFKESGERPDAPNVLVATPTLEMGIDIGDLSTVFLSSLPRSVASYLQRVGRAGRLTGNALNLAFVTGRGEQLPRLQDPLSVINGEVRPPATYLDAEEILQRQYLAHLVDATARDGERAHPEKASGALQSSEPGTFLGELISFAESDVDGHVSRFLGAFNSLTEDTRESLRAWARAEGGPQTSGVARLLHDASHRWSTTLEGLEYRRKAIEEKIPELDEIAHSPAATQDQIRDARVAHGSLRMTTAQVANMKKQWWVAALEEYGILPNYTLLDDSVDLDIALSWVDEDDQYQSTPVTYSRGSRSALSEFAPGAVFYAGGLEIKIDAVDLGIDGTGIRTLALCSACGFTEDATGVDGPSLCPRCGDHGIADVSQRIETLDFTRASAEVRRDENRIADRSDDRTRTNFAVVAAPDIDAQYEKGSWYVDGYDFGARYFSHLTIRWLNLGKGNTQGSPVFVAGREVAAPMFTVCEGCGKQDTTPGANNPWEHRTWCRHRNSPKEQSRTIALTRTLTTQGVLLRLPMPVTVGDDFAVASLKAAILLGLREEFGGSPDHIDVTVTVDPQSAALGGAPADALLLHDIVPGGTGYLADLTNPAKVWSLLRRAWEVLDNCECADSDRLACHRCLLPFARSHEVSSVSRAAAAKHLHDILSSGKTEAAEPPIDAAWTTTTEPPVELNTESYLEQKFRATLQKSLESASAKVTPVPGPHGTKLRVAFPSAKRTWIVEPQISMHGCKPDFVVSSTNPQDGKLAVFTDGYTFHASPLHNRLADDAGKRQVLRDNDVRVLAVTADDVDRWDAETVERPEWMTSPVTEHLMKKGGAAFGAADANAVAEGPIAFLLSWMKDPRLVERRSFADEAGYYFLRPAKVHYAPESESAFESVMLSALRDRLLPPAATPPKAWLWESGVCVLTTHETATKKLRVTLALDDTKSAVEDAAFKSAWREWLRLSNLFGLRETHTTITTLSLLEATAAAGQVASTGETGAIPVVLSAVWRDALDLCETDAERDLVLTASAVVNSTPPELGHELFDGDVVVAGWPDLMVAVDTGLGEDVIGRIKNAGWTVVGPDTDSLTRVFEGEVTA